MSAQPSYLDVLKVDQILETFSSEYSKEEVRDNLSSESKSGMKAIMDSLPELWDDKQYEDE